MDPNVIGKTVSNVLVRPIDELDNYLKENPTSVGVLTVPRAAALDMAERLVQGGVKGIWNFTNVELNISQSDVIVENIHFADSLLALSYMISENET